MTSLLRAASLAMVASSLDSGKAVSIVWLKKRKRKSELPDPIEITDNRQEMYACRVRIAVSTSVALKAEFNIISC